MIQWRFKPNSRDDQNVDPIQAEFFTTRDIGNISTAIIREGIQNALDERNREGQMETVKVRIFLSGKKYAVKPEDYSDFLETLRPHLQSKNSGLQSLPDFTQPMNYLVFEDFNTRGLEGDPKEYVVDDSKDGKKHNFYYFWRNVGRSGKSDDQLGRWGLGKTVFPASSQIHTFWGLTVRKNDQRRMLMGQCILRIHNREDEKREECGFRPYGTYGNYEDESFFATPVEVEAKLEQFESIFRLQRKQNSGLSLIIPFCSDEITRDHLAYSAIEQYFYPILQGRLEVEIASEDETMILEKDTINDAVQKIDFQGLYGEEDKKKRSKESLQKLFDFAKWTFSAKDEDAFRLKAPEINQKPRWVTKLLFEDEERLEVFRDKFDKGDRVAFKIPLKYYPVNGVPKICWYDAFLEKDTTLTRPDNLFVRDGITISGVSSLDKGMVRGIVIIQDSDLARMLGDSENPAHTEWQPDSRNFKGKYIDGKEILSFVKSTLKKIYDHLQRPAQGIQKDLLIDFFSIPIETEKEERQKRLPDHKKGDNEANEEEVPAINGRKRAVIIEKIISGVRLTGNAEAERAPAGLKLRFGYDVPKGNPITAYSEFDFDLSKPPVEIESTGVYFHKREKNILEFDIEDFSRFEVKLTGFDEKRDLVLKLDADDQEV